MDETAHELRATVIRLREEGKSFREIGKLCGISHSRAHQLFRKASKGQKVLTVQQRQYAAQLIQGRKGAEAAELSGVHPDDVGAFIRDTKNNQRFQDYYQRILEEEGLDFRSSVKMLAKIAKKATKVVGLNKVTNKKIEHPDNTNRLKAVQTSVDLHVKLKSQQTESDQQRASVIVVTPETLAQIERMRGGPMPPGTVEVREYEELPEASGEGGEPATEAANPPRDDDVPAQEAEQPEQGPLEDSTPPVEPDAGDASSFQSPDQE